MANLNFNRVILMGYLTRDILNYLKLNITGGIFIENIIGSAGPDHFIGNFQNNHFDGRAGKVCGMRDHRAFDRPSQGTLCAPL